MFKFSNWAICPAFNGKIQSRGWKKNLSGKSSVYLLVVVAFFLLFGFTWNKRNLSITVKAEHASFRCKMNIISLDLVLVGSWMWYCSRLRFSSFLSFLQYDMQLKNLGLQQKKLDSLVVFWLTWSMDFVESSLWLFFVLWLYLICMIFWGRILSLHL